MTESRGADPFDILGVPVRFDLAESVIERAWLARSARQHPDRAGDSAEAGAAIARLNEARRVLANPEERAGALLARLGGPAKEENKSLPDGFLAEMLGIRQDIEEALASGDAAARDTWEQWAIKERSRFVNEVTALFEHARASPSPDALRAIRVQLNAWRYIERLIEQLDPEYDPGSADFRR